MRDTATVSEDSLDLLGRLATENPPPEADSFATNAAPTLGHLQTREVGEVLEHALRRMEKHLRRRDLLELADPCEPTDLRPMARSRRRRRVGLRRRLFRGSFQPAGPQWLRGLSALAPRALAYDKPLCASIDGFTLHAATRAGALDAQGREALLRYVLRPPLAQERVELREDGLVRIALKRAYSDGTVAVDMDPLSLLCRLAASVPPARYHVVKYGQVRRCAGSGEPVAKTNRAPAP